MYYIIYPFFYLLSLLPLGVLHFLGDAIYGIVYHIIQYRKKVVLYNLSIAFPEKNDLEKEQIAREVYHNFIDTFMEAIKLISASEAFIRKRTIADFSILDPLWDKQRVCQAHAGHNYNWELIQHVVPLNTQYPFLGVYMPIKNQVFEKIFYDMRSKTGTVLLRATHMREDILPWRNKPYLIGLVADQNPGDPENAYWLNFFGRPTPFVIGPEKNGKMIDAAIIFVHFTKIKRGYYHLHAKLAFENAAQTEKGEITRAYVRYLEETMRANPGMWLWTHKRWKHAWKSEYAPLWIDDSPMPAAESK
jgi:Kdo2-lipid IVA lauroyltransferase/acyltransferase